MEPSSYLLAPDMVISIFNHFDDERTLVRASAVCKAWNTAYKNSPRLLPIWSHMYKRIWQEDIPQHLESKNAQELFIKRFKITHLSAVSRCLKKEIDSVVEDHSRIRYFSYDFTLHALHDYRSITPLIAEFKEAIGKGSAEEAYYLMKEVAILLKNDIYAHRKNDFHEMIQPLISYFTHLNFKDISRVCAFRQLFTGIHRQFFVSDEELNNYISEIQQLPNGSHIIQSLPNIAIVTCDLDLFKSAYSNPFNLEIVTRKALQYLQNAIDHKQFNIVVFLATTLFPLKDKILDNHQKAIEAKKDSASLLTTLVSIKETDLSTDQKLEWQEATTSLIHLGFLITEPGRPYDPLKCAIMKKNYEMIDHLLKKNNQKSNKISFLYFLDTILESKTPIQPEFLKKIADLFLRYPLNMQLQDLYPIILNCVIYQPPQPIIIEYLQEIFKRTDKEWTVYYKTVWQVYFSVILESVKNEEEDKINIYWSKFLNPLLKAVEISPCFDLGQATSIQNQVVKEYQEKQKQHDSKSSIDFTVYLQAPTHPAKKRKL